MLFEYTAVVATVVALEFIRVCWEERQRQKHQDFIRRCAVFGHYPKPPTNDKGTS